MRIEPAGLAKSIGNQGFPQALQQVVEAAKLLFEADGAGVMLVGKDELLTWASASDPRPNGPRPCRRSKGPGPAWSPGSSRAQWRCGTWRPYRLGRMTAALVTGADGTEPANPIRRSHRGLRLACDLTRRACRVGRRPRSRCLVPMVSRSGGFGGLARLLPGLGGWLLDRRMTHGSSRAVAPGSAWGAPEGFRRTRWRAQCAQQPRKPTPHSQR
jgi:hypothetical protein